MKNILSGGGLGDAALIYAQLYNMNFEKEEYFLTHYMHKKPLMNAVDEFYSSQNINHEIKKIDDPKWYDKNKHKYDIIIYTLEKQKMCAFPEFNITKQSHYNVLIAPVAGRNNDRIFFNNEINNFIKNNSNKKMALVGKGNVNLNYYDYVDNYLNKTTISEVLNLIYSSDVIISPGGFIAIVGGLMGKKVFTKELRQITRNDYYHPEWNNQFINNLNEVII